MSLMDRIAAKPSVRKFFEGKTFIGVLIAGVAIVTGAITVLGEISSADKQVARWLSNAVKRDPVSQALELKPVPEVVLAGIILSWAVLIALVVWAATRRFTRTKEQKSLDEMMGSVRQIIAQGKQDDPIKTWISVHDVYLIGKDFSGTFTRTAIVKTVGQRLHFFEHRIETAVNADAAESLAAIRYKVRDLGNQKNNIVYLPSENEPFRKKACLFFLPPVEQGETRKFEISYEWPGMFNRLKTKADDIGFIAKTLEIMSVFRTEVYLHDDAPGKLKCTITGKRYDNQSLEGKEYSVNGWRGAGFVYETKEVPAGDLDFTLKIEMNS